MRDPEVLALTPMEMEGYTPSELRRLLAYAESKIDVLRKAAG